MPGIRITHATHRSGMYLVPVLAKPFPAETVDQCPSCHLFHLCKTIHLWLDDVGSCIVSKGVLDDLKLAGFPGLSIDAEVVNPPPLNFTGKLFHSESRFNAREKVDNQNRKIVQLGSPVHT